MVLELFLNFHPCFEKFGEHLIGRPKYSPTFSREKTLTPEEEDKVVEALEELRINYNLRQWRVCSLICDSLADKFRSVAKSENK
jgi:hypothetical protein